MLMNAKKSLTERIKLEEFPQPEMWSLKYPVLLCHGFGALASVFSPSPLHDTAIILRQHGIKAFAPNIVPYATIEVRAAAWGKIIARILKDLPEQKIHIVAHSMSGLDIRYALQRLDLEPHVASLITLCSPHHGSPLANLALETPDVLRETMIKMTNYFGSKTYPEIDSNALGALHQLSPEYVTEDFNQRCPWNHNIPLYCITASCGLGTGIPIGASLNVFNRYIFDREGENDGFVSRKSAEFGEVLYHTDLSHYEQIRLFLRQRDEERWKNLWTIIYNKQKDIETEKATVKPKGEAHVT